MPVFVAGIWFSNPTMTLDAKQHPATLPAPTRSPSSAPIEDRALVGEQAPCHRHRRDIPPGALDFSAAGHLYATHPLHAFAARCPPPLAHWAIETFTDPGDYVLDVMCGSGTTLVEAVLTGRHGWGADIDPLARLLAEVKATFVAPAAVEALAAAVEQTLTGDLDDTWRPSLPNLERWFRADVRRDLARLRGAIMACAPQDGPVRRLAWVVFSSLIVARTSVANARDLVHSRHHYRLWKEDPDTTGRYLRALRRAGRLMADFGERLAKAPAAPGMPRLVGDDAQALSVATGYVDLVFFSPPYVSALDYPRAHMFAVAWLADVLGTTTPAYQERARDYIGTDRAALARATRQQPLPPPSGFAEVDAVVDELAHAPARAWVVARYFADMAAVFAECARVVRPGGHVVLVVCPSNIRRVRVDTHSLFVAMAPTASEGRLVVEDTYERTIHDHRRVMPYLESAFGERMRTEYVLVLRRGSDRESS
jgi:site-specific DNA-methyltransferase (cytosine-N4-specific)